MPAIPAFQKARIDIIVLSYSYIKLLPPGPHVPHSLNSSKISLRDDSLMVILNDNLIVWLNLHIFAIDFLSGVLPLSKRTNIKIVLQYVLDGNDSPLRAALSLILKSGCLFSLPLNHPWRWVIILSEVKGNPLVAPAI